MDTCHRHTATGNPTSQRTVGLIALVALLTGPAAATEIAHPAPEAEPSASAAMVPIDPAAAIPDGRPDTNPAATSGDAADHTADFAGGIAARLRDQHGDSVPGDVFLLMAVEGSDIAARVYDRTPFSVAPVHPETIESNRAAAHSVGAITGHDVRMIDLTSAPGGGPSAGITYTIAYLNMLSDGGFTGQLRVAATGELGEHDYIRPIDAIDEKTAAADLAGVDVLFTPSVPTADTASVHAARVVGEMFRARNTGATLADERRWDNYHTWGGTRPTAGMDIVAIRHLGDVAAYLCGAGSDEACSITDLLADVVIAPTTADRPDETPVPAVGQLR